MYTLDMFLAQLNLTGVTFFLVWLGFYCTSKPNKTDETAQKDKPIRTRKQRVMNVLLAAAGILALCQVSHTVLSLIVTGPLAALILFFISLTQFIRAKRRQRISPEESFGEEIAFYKKRLIIFSVILAVVLAAFVGFILLLFSDVAYM